MQYKQNSLDYFLQQRISDNAKELKCKFNETLHEEQSCLEQIRYSISHCKENIAACEKHIKKNNVSSTHAIENRKLAFKDNLTIWNMIGHIQMTSIEMKEYLKRLCVNDIDEWEQRAIIKSVYTAIYETSKKLVDCTSETIVFIKRNFPSFDYGIFAASRKELTKFRDNKTAELTHIRKSLDAHRESDIAVQVDILEELHISNAVQLIIEYGSIVNNLGSTTQPIIELGLKRLQDCFESY